MKPQIGFAKENFEFFVAFSTLRENIKTFFWKTANYRSSKTK
jgi:hypothetical protein